MPVVRSHPRTRPRPHPRTLLVVLSMLTVLVGIGWTSDASAAASTATPQIVTGSEHSCALLTDGTVRCWGHNQDGQNGDGTTTIRTNPVQVLLPDNTPLSGVTQISALNTHTCALLDDTTVRCWGRNSFGKLGDGTATDRSTAVQVVLADGTTPLRGATQVSAGGEHTCALLDDETVRCWGLNDSGQLGDGNTTAGANPPVTVREGGAALAGVTAIDAGQVHTCALLDDGTARCWGFNGGGRLGDGTTTARHSPVQVLAIGSTQGTDTLREIAALSAGGGHTCAHMDGGTVRCWGLNTFGQLGNGTTTSSENPNPVTVLVAAGGAALSTVSAVSAGTQHTCAALDDGTARCWGAGSGGQLGDGTATSTSVPVTVTGLTGTDVIRIAAAANHTCALVATGDVTARCWGDGRNGRLGDGSNLSGKSPTFRSTPVRVLASGTEASDPVVLVLNATAPTGGGSSAPTASIAVACTPATITVGTEVTCTITGGDPGIDILWRAAFNPTIASDGVTLDANGTGTFTFTVPASAVGRELTVELVEWTAPVSLGVAGGPLPSGVPAGQGPAPADAPLALAGLLGLVGLLAVAGLGGLIVARATARSRRTVATSSR